MNDAWFTWYRGKGRFKISPRTMQGWLSLLIFVLWLAAVTTAIAFYVPAQPWKTVAHIVFVGISIFAFVRFAMGRAEIIDIDEIARDMKEFRAWKERGKRR